MQLRHLGHREAAEKLEVDDARELGLERPFLHAWRIAFDHPITGERIDLEDPLPPDLERALERARSGSV